VFPIKTKYLLKGLDCAHCAAKIEEAVKSHPAVESAALNFIDKSLRVEDKENSRLSAEEIQVIVSSIEDGVTVETFSEAAGFHDGEEEDAHGDFHEIKLLALRILAGIIFLATAL